MAFNQVSLSFYARRWREQVAPHPDGLTFGSGKPVQLVETVRTVDDSALPVSPVEVSAWLLDRGFESLDWDDALAYRRGRVRSSFGEEKEIEVQVCVKAGEVTDVYARFTLPQPDPPALDDWAAFVDALCGRFALRLPDSPEAVGSGADFEDVVLRSENYRIFARNSGWA